MKYAALFLFAVIAGQLTHGVEAQVGSPFDKNFGDVKFLNAYFGKLNEKIEVAPGDKNVPFTVVFANVGSQDITGIKGQLQLPMGFSPVEGKGALILAESQAEALAGRHFHLTFFVNLDQNISVQQYPASIKIDYSRLREAGQRTAFFEIQFRVTGEGILNLKATDPFLTSLKNNPITVEVVNSGTAPLANMKIILENTQTALSSTTASVTNMEKVVFDQNKWDLGTIPPQTKKHFTFNVYVPETLSSNTLRTVMDITYFNAHGDQINVKRSVDFYISGFIDAKIYNVGVISLADKQTIIGEVINEGNANALFSFVTLEPLEGSNLISKTQFIDKLDVDSPVPFNIPVEFDGEPQYGEHKIKITVRYKDDLRNEHLITNETTVTIKDMSSTPEPSIFDGMPLILGIAIAIIVGTLVYKKKRKGNEDAE
jgi:hypothetical protein